VKPFVQLTAIVSPAAAGPTLKAMLAQARVSPSLM
jgi:hypothetical protein